MRIPVVFAINNAYVKQLSTVIVSILLNSSKDNTFEFNIMHSDITDENKVKIRALKKFNLNTEFNFIDMSTISKEIDLEKYMSRRSNYTYISPETYFRLFISDIFPQLDKIIYLDADILVLQDLKELYEEDITDYYVGAVDDTGIHCIYKDENIKTDTMPNMPYKEYFSLKLKKKDSRYFNAGVLLLNLDKIRKDNMKEKLLEYMIDESPLQFQDQDVLNSIFADKTKYIDYKWNVLKDTDRNVHSYFGEERAYLEKTYANPAIFHYVWSNKPWILTTDTYDYNFLGAWWDYYKLTTVYDKSDLKVYKAIQRVLKNENFKVFTITLMNFKLIDVEKFINNNRLHITLLNVIKLKTKLKSKEVKIA